MQLIKIQDNKTTPTLNLFFAFFKNLPFRLQLFFFHCICLLHTLFRFFWAACTCANKVKIRSHPVILHEPTEPQEAQRIKNKMDLAKSGVV